MYGLVDFFFLAYDSLHICLHSTYCIIALLLGTVQSKTDEIPLLSVENVARKARLNTGGIQEVLQDLESMISTK